MGLLIGVGLALGGLLLAFVIEGGAISSFFNLSAYVVIFGGTLGAGIASFGLDRILRIPMYVRLAMGQGTSDSEVVINQLVGMAARAFRDGALSIEADIEAVTDPFLYKGMRMYIDGIEMESIISELELEISAMDSRHQRVISMFTGLGGYSPTMGIIGTVMGLVQALSQLSNPSQLGHSIATAFVATLVGVAMANIVWLPLAENLRGRNSLEMERRQMIMTGVISIASTEVPRVIEERLRAFGLGKPSVNLHRDRRS